MLSTPFGRICMQYDGRNAAYKIEKIQPDERLYPDVDGCYRIEFDFTPDGETHILACIVNNTEMRAGSETGEDFEAVAFYSEKAKMTLGCAGDFSLDNARDYSGELLDNGLKIKITKQTQVCKFVFGVCWMEHYTEENEIQTWYGADPTIKNPC